MNGKDLIQSAFALKPVPRAPWVPFVGVHAASLLDKTAEEYLQSEDLMYEGLCKAIEQYKPDGFPVSFDLQMEAELLHCGLHWSKDNPPSVASHPMGEGGTMTLADMVIPKPEAGNRIEKTMNVTRRIREQYPDIALYGLITGPFTLALHLCGTDIFMNMFTDEQGVHDVMAFCTKVACAMSDYYIEAGCDVVAIVDPMCSQIGPDQFEQFVSKSCTDVFAHIREKKALSSFFVCGQAQHNIEVMCQCKPDNISIDENIPLDFVRDTCLANNVSYGGNLKLTTVLLLGNVEQTKKNVLECLDIAGEEYKGFILAPGCDLAYATPSANLEVIAPFIADSYQQDVARALSVEEEIVEKLNLDEYIDPKVVQIDCVTLDSKSCAPCQYMYEAALRAAEKYGNKVVVREHAIKTHEGIDFMKASCTTDIPSMLIEGEVSFRMQMPPVEKIQAIIDEALKTKEA